MLRILSKACWLLTAVVGGVAGPNFEPAHAQTAYTIDVLVVYPQSAEEQMQRIVQWQRNWGETEMGPFLETNFVHVSEIYQQSGIDVDLNVVHHQEIDLSYISPSWGTTLSLALMNSELGTAAYVPYIAAIEALRNEHAADIVIYWRDFQDGGPTSNGAGSIGGPENEAYVHLTYGGIAPTVVAHETGHLLGGQHSDGLQGTAAFSIDGDTATLREYRTVMTIAYPLGLPDYRYVWRFSSDDSGVTGDIDCSQLTGRLATCSFSSTASLGDASHDAATVLSAMVPVVASFRNPPPLVPVTGPFAQGLLVLLLTGVSLIGFKQSRI